MNESKPPSRVTELQGLYGPLQILEGKVQKVWFLQELQIGEWRTRTGKRLHVRFPGRWNRGPGPDFNEAVIEMEGEVRVGDVELHLYREDWWRHGHDQDARYDGVILHIVLFGGGMDRTVETRGGSIPEEWIMGPWMREDLESVSGGEPGLFGELVPELREWMESDDPKRIRERLKTGADRRWQDKESMARCLHKDSGWAGGLHRMVLYYLGFPFNRRPFFEMAEAYPMVAWQEKGLIQTLKEDWSQSVRWGLGRPANRAERRLGQYLGLNHGHPDWAGGLQDPPAVLRIELSQALDMLWLEEGTRGLRRQAGFSRWRQWLHQIVLGGHFSPSLADRLWVDVFLPFLVVDGRLAPEEAMALWFHGSPAVFPDAYRDLLKLADIQVNPRYPLCNGWIQGVLWLEEQLRLERIRTSLGAGKPVQKGSGA